MVFKAYAVTNEIDLNRIAAKCNIPKKYTWEEPLILNENVLSSIFNKEIPEGQKILVFSFGSIVFINCPSEHEKLFIEYLKNEKIDIDVENYKEYSDDYELQVRENAEIELTDSYLTVPKFEFFYPELVSTVIAKSVALEKTEEHLSTILDTLETMILFLSIPIPWKLREWTKVLCLLQQYLQQ